MAERFAQNLQGVEVAQGSVDDPLRIPAHGHDMWRLTEALKSAYDLRPGDAGQYEVNKNDIIALGRRMAKKAFGIGKGNDIEAEVAEQHNQRIADGRVIL
jgi:hypothetical protein